MFKLCRTSSVKTGSISSSGVWKCWTKCIFNRCKFNDDALLYPFMWLLSCQPETYDVWRNKGDLVYLVQLKSKLWLFDVKEELVFRQVYLQGAFVWHRALYRSQSSHNHQAKEKEDRGSNKACRESSFQLWISRIVVCVSCAGHTSVFQIQGLDCFHTQLCVSGSWILCLHVAWPATN